MLRGGLLFFSCNLCIRNVYCAHRCVFLLMYRGRAAVGVEGHLLKFFGARGCWLGDPSLHLCCPCLHMSTYTLHHHLMHLDLTHSFLLHCTRTHSHFIRASSAWLGLPCG